LLNPVATHKNMEDEKNFMNISLHVCFLREVYGDIQENDANNNLQVMLYEFVLAIIHKYTSKQLHERP
jgi:hypothetical protein